MMEEFLFTSEPESVSELHREKALLTAMLQRARLYHTSRLYLDLLEFVNRLPHIAAFNALLMSIQKPGLRFAASAGDWCVRFNRTINEGARPLVILWPFGPVAFVYDVEDTSGDPLPELAARTFRASGPIDSVAIAGYEHRLWRKGIDLGLIAYGDGYAGQIAADGLIAVHQSLTPKEKSLYRLRINSRHEPNVQFSTLIHELAHLYLGHL